jgi:hypothetical protein
MKKGEYDLSRSGIVPEIHIEGNNNWLSQCGLGKMLAFHINISMAPGLSSTRDCAIIFRLLVQHKLLAGVVIASCHEFELKRASAGRGFYGR